MEDGPFDLGALFRRIEGRRVESGQTWSALSKQTRVSATTIRRFETADDAEADGVLALIAWLDTEPEEFISGRHCDAERLMPTNGGLVRVDMARVAAVTGGRRVTGRTTIQTLARTARASGRSVASFTRWSPI